MRKAYLSDKGVGKDAVEILKKAESWSGGGGFERLLRKGGAPEPQQGPQGAVQGLGCRSPCVAGRAVSEAVTRRTSLKLPRKVVFGRRSSRRRNTRYNRDQPQARLVKKDFPGLV